MPLSMSQFSGMSGTNKNMGKTLGGISGSMGGGMNKMPGYTTLPGKVIPGPKTTFGPKSPGFTTMPATVPPGGYKPGGNILKQPGVALLGGNK